MRLAELTVGLELAVVHLFKILVRQNVVSQADAVISLKEARESLPPQASGVVKLALRHIEEAVAVSHIQSGSVYPTPETLRSRLRIIPGGVADGSSLNTNPVE